MKITICIGSACHLKGSKKVVNRLQELIADNNLMEKAEMTGAFCMKKCGEDGVRVMVDDKIFSVMPENVDEFFNTEILSKMN